LVKTDQIDSNLDNPNKIVIENGQDQVKNRNDIEFKENSDLKNIHEAQDFFDAQTLENLTKKPSESKPDN